MAPIDFGTQPQPKSKQTKGIASVRKKMATDAAPEDIRRAAHGTAGWHWLHQSYLIEIPKLDRAIVPAMALIVRCKSVRSAKVAKGLRCQMSYQFQFRKMLERRLAQVVSQEVIACPSSAMQTQDTSEFPPKA